MLLPAAALDPSCLASAPPGFRREAMIRLSRSNPRPSHLQGWTLSGCATPWQGLAFSCHVYLSVFFSFLVPGEVCPMRRKCFARLPAPSFLASAFVSLLFFPSVFIPCDATQKFAMWTEVCPFNVEHAFWFVGLSESNRHPCRAMVLYPVCIK